MNNHVINEMLLIEKKDNLQKLNDFYNKKFGKLPITKIANINENLLVALVKFNNVNIIKFIYQKFNSRQSYLSIFIAIKIAIQYDFIEILKFLIEEFNLIDTECLEMLLNFAKLNKSNKSIIYLNTIIETNY